MPLHVMEQPPRFFALAYRASDAPFSLPCYLQGSKNGRVVTIGKHSRLNRQIWYRHPNSGAGNDEIQNFQREDFYFDIQAQVSL
jgi:hypothetical protein